MQAISPPAPASKQQLLPSPAVLSSLLRAVFPNRRLAVCLREIDPSGLAPGKNGSDVGSHALLNQAEQEQLARYCLPKRRQQWQAGRLGALAAIADYLQQPITLPRRWTIAAAVSGRPILEGQLPSLLQGTDISISHSGSCAAALCADTRGGIDIQQISPQVVRVAEKFCLPEERVLLGNALPELNTDSQLTLLWTAKEAVQKALSMEKSPSFLAISCQHLQRCRLDGWQGTLAVRSATGGEHLLTAALTIFPGYALSVCLVE